MGIRHLARQRALQFLYAFEYSAKGSTFEEIEDLFLGSDQSRRRGWGPFARALARATAARRKELDTAIGPLLRHWKLERLPRVDLLCLRVALCELREFAEIPLRVTIDEYIELSRLFSTEESPQYINAVLDQLAREFPQKDFQAREEATTGRKKKTPEKEDEVEDENENKDDFSS